MIEKALSDPNWNQSVTRQFQELIKGPIERISERTQQMEVTVKEVDFMKGRRKIFEDSPHRNPTTSNLSIPNLQLFSYGKEQRLLSLVDRKRDVLITSLALTNRDHLVYVCDHKDAYFEGLENKLVVQVPSLSK